MKTIQLVNMFRRISTTFLFVAGKQKKLGLPCVIYGGHHSNLNVYIFRRCPVAIPLKSKEMNTNGNGEMPAVLDSLQISDKTVIIDVRGRAEIAQHGKISGAINIPLIDVEYALTNLSEEDFKLKYRIDRPLPNTPLVFVCSHGMRSSLAYQTAIELGFKDVRFARIKKL